MYTSTHTHISFYDLTANKKRAKEKPTIGTPDIVNLKKIYEDLSAIIKMQYLYSMFIK